MSTWERELAGDCDATFILEGIKSGFSLIDPTTDIAHITPSEIPNHRSATDPRVKLKVENCINNELLDNNYKVTQAKPVIVSALGSIPKKDGNIRLIHDCSLPETTSLNSYATKDPCEYQTVTEALSLIKPGWFMAKVDLESAYQSVGNSLDHTKKAYTNIANVPQRRWIVLIKV